MKVAITGYKADRIKGQEPEIRKWLSQQLGQLAAENGTLDCYSSMNTGTDQIFGFAALADGHRLHCVYPYPKKINLMSKHLENQAKSIVYIYKTKDRKAVATQSRYLVDNCDVLLVVWDEVKQGDVWYTVDYARKTNKEIIYMEIA